MVVVTDILIVLAWVCLAATVVVLFGGLFYMLRHKERDPQDYAMNVNRIFMRRVAFQLAAVFFIATLLWLGGKTGGG